MLAGAADWPQLQHDPAHTGYSPDQPDPPYRVLWLRDLEEPMQTASQPVVADGKLFIGTGHGRLYALDRETGKTAWHYDASAPIFGSPAWHNRVVYVNGLDRRCHAVRSRDGQRLWTFETGAPLWAAPVAADGKVFVAGRDGFVYALDATSGALAWKAPVGGPVLSTPACADGALYVGAGDMHVYALDGQTGRQLWRSPKIPGAAMREYWLVAHKGTLVVTTQLVFASHTTQQFIQKAVMNPFNERHKDDPALVEDEIFPELVKWYEAHPHHKTFHVLDAATGREKLIAPIIGVNGGSCTTPPPAVAPDGWAYTPYANVWLAASGWCFFGRLHLATGKFEPLITGRYAPKLQYPREWHWQPKKGTAFGRTSTWDGGFSVIDQSWGVSLGGDRAFPVRDPSWPGNPPFNNTVHIPTRTDRYLLPDTGNRRRLGEHGTFGSGFHSTCCPPAVSGRDLFQKTARSVLICYRGTLKGGR